MPALLSFPRLIAWPLALIAGAALEKFETLPYVLGLQESVTGALTHRGERARIERVNDMFKAIQVQSKIGAIYLLDRAGDTIAASNWVCR